MRTPHGHAVAYNAQTAVDVEHKLIVAFDLTNEGNDYRQLHPMAVQGKAAVGADEVGWSCRHRPTCRDGQSERGPILQP